MNVINTNLIGVVVIEPFVFDDFRGRYVEIYNNSEYEKHLPNIEFIQDDISVSRKHVLRGFHGDNNTWKLVSCLYGEFYLVVLNYDENSPSFGKWQSFILSDRTYRQVLIPPKHGNGHLVLSDQAVFHYKQSTYYDRSTQFTVKWNDPRFNVVWPISNPILSERDR